MDPKVTLKDLLEASWAVDFTPKFSTDWYEAEEEMPQVTVSHLFTTPKILAFSSDMGSAQRRIEGVYSIDVWSRGDQDKRWRMMKEVDRIIHTKCNHPSSDIEFIEVSNWRDLDELDVHPRIYRSQVRVQVLYYG